MPEVASSGNPADEELEAAKKRIGQTLGGKWRLDKLLGLGGMAAVYSATHKNNLKNVAVKVLHSELQRNETVRTRFLREGYVANKVGHPGAVAAIDDGTDPSGAVFLVMELLSGESLASRVDSQGGKLPEREVFEVAEGILDVLAAAHAQNIVHRDLKPDNVFLIEGGVKLLDFGVARVLDTTEAKTRTGIVMGTPEYMPPEQARGRSEHIDGRTDLWATAAMMFRLLTGRYVHIAETQNEVLLLAMTEHPKKLAEVMPTAHPKVAAVIDRALQYEPLDRFPDAEAMRAAVKDALATLDDNDGDRESVDDAAPTIQVTDFVSAATQSGPIVGAKPPDESPKPGLWVHTKATTPEPPKAPARKRAIVPILVASGAITLLCVGIVYGLPRLRQNGPHAVSSTSTPATFAVVPDESDADVDAGDEEFELDDEDAAPYAPPPKPQPTTHVTPKPKGKTKKKRH